MHSPQNVKNALFARLQANTQSVYARKLKVFQFLFCKAVWFTLNCYVYVFGDIKICHQTIQNLNYVFARQKTWCSAPDENCFYLCVSKQLRFLLYLLAQRLCVCLDVLSAICKRTKIAIRAFACTKRNVYIHRDFICVWLYTITKNVFCCHTSPSLSLK